MNEIGLNASAHKFLTEHKILKQLKRSRDTFV